jgi:hypothetical protein
MHLASMGRQPVRQRTHALSPTRRAARGLTLIGLLFWAGLVACVGYLVVRTAPTIVEYRAIARLVSQIAAANPPTVADARQTFDKQREVEYGINSVTGKDLSVTKDNEKVVIGFSYDKEIPLYGPVRLLIKFEGQSD